MIDVRPMRDDVLRVGAAALPSAPAAQEIDDSRLDQLEACYGRFARCENGFVARSASWWRDRIWHAPGSDRAYRYAACRNDELTAYMVYEQEPVVGDLPYSFNINCRELIWNDADGLRALLGYAAAHGPFAGDVRWPGAVTDTVAMSIGARVVQVVSTYPWMTRLVNVPLALESRGYAADLSAAAALHVVDPVLPQNDRAFRVTVADGRCRAECVTSASARIDVGALAAIYTGWLPAHDAIRMGRLQADEATVAALHRMFGGRTPWMMERF